MMIGSTLKKLLTIQISPLSKLKEAHPSLTKNDLKLCAYLRLNLSSKEIAPLLNISVHSVEIKRYRLRKNGPRKKSRNCRVYYDFLKTIIFLKIDCLI